MRQNRPIVLALGMEGTLISESMSQIARPGLYAFLSRCRELFPRIVIFTTINEPCFRDMARLLVDEGSAPDWFAAVEYVTWRGRTKDLQFIPHIQWQQALLLDDYVRQVHPGQESHYLQVDFFGFPFDEADTGLATVLGMLEQRLSASSETFA